MAPTGGNPHRRPPFPCPAPVMNPAPSCVTALLVFVALACPRLAAEVRCAKIFGDHMVLQRELPVPVWGEAEPGETVTVSFAGQSQTTKAGADGRWRATLAPLTASTEPRELSVRGANTLSFADVLVGEVWFCSGQSNMEKPFGPRKGQRPVIDHDLEIAAARYPKLRLYQVPRTDQKQDAAGRFAWLPCSPETLRISDFSAVAYTFGRQIHQTLDVPVGLVHASFGGTFIEAWMPPEAFAAPPLQGLEKRRLQAWVDGVQATELYRDMVAPLAPFSLRGFLWYQGETNLMNGDIALYAEKQTALIETWRRAWERPDAPFYGVLLAPMDYSKWEKFPVTVEALPAFRVEQARALSAPHTGYVVTTDLVADTHDIHPVNKRDVGLRLARLALAETYGREDIPARGPTFATMRATEAGDALKLEFEYAAGLRTRDGQGPSEFVVAGEDRVFHPASARIETGRVFVSSPRVPRPVAVRLGWHETASPNLINAAGLPAVPFPSDDWASELLRPLPAEAPPPPAR
jgi:sialate O-acetylesterase